MLFNTVDALPPLRNELHTLSREGWSTLVVELAYGHGSSDAEELSHVERRRLPVALRSLSTRQSSRFLKLLRYGEYTARAFRAVLFCRSPLVVAHDLTALVPAFLACRLAGKRIVYNAHELQGESGAGVVPFPPLWRWLDRRLCRRVDAMIVPEANRARIYRDEYGARDPLVVPNVPLRRDVAPSPELRAFLASRGVEADVIVLYQGLIDPSRNIHVLVDAMASVPAGVVLVLLGGGDAQYLQALEERARACGVEPRVLIHPRVPYAEVAAITAAADAGVLLYRNDSRNNYYCAPNKLYEYMHAGLPVITSDFPGLRALVEGNDIGICVDPEDAAAVAAAITALSDPSRRAEMCERSLRLARESYHWDAVSAAMLSLYSSLASGREKRS
jgi:glycosyltransferase involved in cell wall biosynthesis